MRRRYRQDWDASAGGRASKKLRSRALRLRSGWTSNETGLLILARSDRGRAFRIAIPKTPAALSRGLPSSRNPVFQPIPPPRVTSLPPSILKRISHSKCDRAKEQRGNLSSMEGAAHRPDQECSGVSAAEADGQHQA